MPGKTDKPRLRSSFKRQVPNTVTSNKLEMLVTIVSRNKTEYYLDLLQSFEINMQMIVHGKGTANAKTLNLLGLTDTDKSVIFSIIQEKKIPKAMDTLGEKFQTIRGGKGVAFTIPLTSVIGKMIFGFLSNNRTVQEGN